MVHGFFQSRIDVNSDLPGHRTGFLRRNIDHMLIIQTSWGTAKTLALRPQSVADFYAEFMSALRSLGVAVKIWTMPQEDAQPGAL